MNLSEQHPPLALEPLVQALAPALLRYLQRYVGDPALAQDLQQETLIRMMRGLPDFAGRSSVKTWAFAIASRVAADHFRDPAHKLHIVEVDEALDVPSPDRQTEAQAIADEMNQCVRQVIDSLPESYRAALILRDLEELPVEQVAEISECTVATAKIRIHRARQRLKEALGAQCAFYRDPEGIYRCDRKV